jgi:hypothetical protein
MEQTIQSSSLADPVAQPVASNLVTIEYSSAGVKRNGANGWSLMGKEIADNRRLIWLLIRRDISVRYRQSILGYVRAVLPPLFIVATFAFLNASRVLPIGNTHIPYVTFATSGLSVWQLLAGCLSACTASLVASGALVTKVNFPRETLSSRRSVNRAPLSNDRVSTFRLKLPESLLKFMVTQYLQ